LERLSRDSFRATAATPSAARAKAYVKMAGGDRERPRDILGRLTLDVDSTEQLGVAGPQSLEKPRTARARTARSLRLVARDIDVRHVRRAGGTP
jgi:hypothetical protein